MSSTVLTTPNPDSAPRASACFLNSLLVPFLLCFAEVVLLQWLDGAYSSGFGGHPDEAAHFVSALMVREFFSLTGQVRPLEFAQTYYLHFPKVAIGNWPPLMYGVAGLWFLLFGVSRTSALLFIASVASATGTLLFALGRKLLSPTAGLFAAFLYLALPLVQESSAMMMTEHLVTLLILASAMLFARFAESAKLQDALLFGTFATAAILTRGSAWALIFVPPVVIALTRRWSILWDWRLWLGSAPVVLLCVPWYLWAKGMSHGAMVGLDANAPLAFFSTAMTKFPAFTAIAAGPVLLLMFLVGVVRYTYVRGKNAAYWYAAIASMLGILLIQSIVPASIERRFMVQLLPEFLLLATGGCALLLCRLPATITSSPVQRVATWAMAALLALAPVFALTSGIRNTGYETASQYLLDGTRDLNSPAVLLISDSVGEGSVIAAIAAQRPANHVICVRGSKILATEDWLGRNSKERYATAEELGAMMDMIPVDAVMVDAAILPMFHRPYHDKVSSFMTGHPERWRAGGTFEVVRAGKTIPDAVRIYFRIRDGSTALPASTNISLVDKLMQRD